MEGQQRRAASFVRGTSPLIIRYLQTTILQYYQSQRGPGGWPPLAASTVARKGHSTILLESGRLLASLTTGDSRRRSPDTINEVSRMFMRWGTRVPYAGYHEIGEGVPKRSFMVPGRQAGDFAARRSAEHVLRLTPGSLGRGVR